MPKTCRKTPGFSQKWIMWAVSACISTDDLLFKRNEIDRTIRLSSLHLPHNTGTQRLKLDDLVNKLKHSDSPMQMRCCRYYSGIAILVIPLIRWSKHAGFYRWTKPFENVGDTDEYCAWESLTRLALQALNNGQKPARNTCNRGGRTDWRLQTWLIPGNGKGVPNTWKTIDGRKELAVLAEKRVCWIRIWNVLFRSGQGLKPLLACT